MFASTSKFGVYSSLESHSAACFVCICRYGQPSHQLFVNVHRTTMGERECNGEAEVKQLREGPQVSGRKFGAANFGPQSHHPPHIPLFFRDSTSHSHSFATSTIFTPTTNQPVTSPGPDPIVILPPILCSSQGVVFPKANQR
uniref:Uncharacterized protein n=1 Tax=Globodera rostochiensis TaxID=31243 RepID=A0A914GXL1_GLORO